MPSNETPNVTGLWLLFATFTWSRRPVERGKAAPPRSVIGAHKNARNRNLGPRNWYMYPARGLSNNDVPLFFACFFFLFFFWFFFMLPALFACCCFRRLLLLISRPSRWMTWRMAMHSIAMWACTLQCRTCARRWHFRLDEKQEKSGSRLVYLIVLEEGRGTGSLPFLKLVDAESHCPSNILVENKCDSGFLGMFFFPTLRHRRSTAFLSQPPSFVYFSSWWRITHASRVYSIFWHVFVGRMIARRKHVSAWSCRYCCFVRSVWECFTWWPLGFDQNLVQYEEKTKMTVVISLDGICDNHIKEDRGGLFFDWYDQQNWTIDMCCERNCQRQMIAVSRCDLSVFWFPPPPPPLAIEGGVTAGRNLAGILRTGHHAMHRERLWQWWANPLNLLSLSLLFFLALDVVLFFLTFELLPFRVLWAAFFFLQIPLINELAMSTPHVQQSVSS